jgi:hypothetical protein
MEKVKYCEWCEKNRTTHTDIAVLSSDEHGKLGEFTHFFCNTCGYAITSEFRKYQWYVITDAVEAKGPFAFKLEAMLVARNTPGEDVSVRAKVGEREGIEGIEEAQRQDELGY